MTAQQQLAELLANDPDEMFDQTYRYVHFIREHGPAIAELIEMTRLLAYEPLRSGEKSDATIRKAAALRKLTQEATQ